MCVAMCVDMCMDMQSGVCGDGPVYNHVNGHASRRICAHACLCARRQMHCRVCKGASVYGNVHKDA